jgi:hypothetical protein
MRTPFHTACLVLCVVSTIGCSDDRETGDPDAMIALGASPPDARRAGAIVTGRPCDSVPTAEQEIAEQQTARIPLVAELTFGYVWVGPDSALIDRHAIAGARLTTSDAGAARPLETNDTPEGRARNRGVELTRP